MAPPSQFPWEEAPPGGQGDADAARTPCNYCVGLSLYTKAMWAARAMPECYGVELQTAAKRARVEEVKRDAPPPRPEEFSFIGVGVSVYAPEWMEEGKHMPLVRGLGVITIRTDQDDMMRRMEERKRIMRELQKADGEGDDRGGDDDDRDIYGLGDEEDEDPDDAGAPLVERGMVPMKKPGMPPVIPTPISINDVMNKAAGNAKHSAEAMYNFWARRLDGIGDRYVESCRRIVAQMGKQATSVPHSVAWLSRQIRDRTFGKRGGDDDGDHRGGKW